MRRVKQEFGHRMHMLSIYIAEAHAKDVWPLGDKVSVLDHKDMDERLAVANQFVADTGYDIPMLVDTMSNEFDDSFAAWPERYYLIRSDGTIEHLPLPTHEFGYDRDKFFHRIELMMGSCAAAEDDVSAPTDPSPS